MLWIFLGVFGAGVWMAMQLPLQDELGPGPGFFPLWLGGIGAALAVLLIIEVARQPADVLNDGEADPAAGVAVEASLIPDRRALLQILATFAAVAGVAFALEPLGYRLTALAFTPLVLLALGARSPVAIPVISLIASFGVFHVFYHWLKVPLPIGMLGV